MRTVLVHLSSLQQRSIRRKRPTYCRRISVWCRWPALACSSAYERREMDFVRYVELDLPNGRHVLTSSGGVVWTQMSMGSAQALSAAWLTAKMEDHKRPIALAAYVMSIQLANFPGNQLFRAEGLSFPWVVSLRLQVADFCRCTQVLARSCDCSVMRLCCRCYNSCLEVVVSSIRSSEYGRKRCARYIFRLKG